MPKKALDRFPVPPLANPGILAMARAFLKVTRGGA
jgi:hypothetical protein